MQGEKNPTQFQETQEAWREPGQCRASAHSQHGLTADEVHTAGSFILKISDIYITFSDRTQIHLINKKLSNKEMKASEPLPPSKQGTAVHCYAESFL